ncbi:MerR family transcriptional regulator [Actinoplanes sp. NBRC 101535]|uniref:MerR family transcriptional regulator n=1 Tax=Actinoplanes sp. NBRC 101535 TaxID=3032196 RepID=UPI002553C4E9|nr:MerR family transcriptional regulator [Actinoplanes sp. NBRC 101535]
MWTMEQLVERVHAALTAEYPGAPNGRVRDLPDRRAIRWYTTTGLVDRPLGMRGRTALYGTRHLLQLVAIKRRQAAGRTLAEIQAELAGATDTALADAARVPDDLLDADVPPASPPARPDFWKNPPRVPAPPVTFARPSAPMALDPAGLHHGNSDAPLLTGIPLSEGVILLVPHPVDGLDRDALAVAARPLLDLLASRGLTDGRNE